MPEIILSDGVLLWVQVILGIIVGMAVRDLANGFVQGLFFKIQSQFEQGDHIIIDGCRGVVVSIGYRRAVFRLEKEDGMITWRYVPNSKISNLKLEKIVEDTEDTKILDIHKRLERLEHQNDIKD